MKNELKKEIEEFKEEAEVCGATGDLDLIAQMEQYIVECEGRLTAIAEMPEYDQDDSHRLRHMAKAFLSENAQM